MDGLVPSQTKSVTQGTPLGDAEALWAYGTDVWQRSVLFWDTLRKRANDVLDREASGAPDVLAFRYETLLDARRFGRPVNYALLRITAYGSDEADHCLNPDKPPLIVMDPRAGSGPGIGGFRRESELGIALHEGHPVYFVTFFPEPCPSQTLIDVLHALRQFADEVIRRHPGKLPILYGNCQAGWAAILLALHCKGALGPVVLNGSPLSYWSGEPGVNPMRLAGGLTGGIWPVRLLADLGDGRFDGAWLVQNFEMLKPELTLWEKYSTLFQDPMGEHDRFLAFERWWNSFYALSREEITAIVRHLFIGNELERGVLDLGDGVGIDLRNLRSPVVVFASYGDDISPPHQSLAWIRQVYRSTEALKAAGQRIIYLLDRKVGHLGIFVSASVARFEHRAILDAMPDVDALPSGLYEMMIENPTGDPDCRRPQYHVGFEPRQVEDLPFEDPPAAFERARRVSEAADQAYGLFVAPWMRAVSNPATAEVLRWLHPMRSSRYLLSEKFSPWMHGVAATAEFVRNSRASGSTDNAWRLAEQGAIDQAFECLRTMRRFRDIGLELVFRALFGDPPTVGEATDISRQQAGPPAGSMRVAEPEALTAR